MKTWAFAMLALACYDLGVHAQEPAGSIYPNLITSDSWAETGSERGETQIAVFGGQAWTQSSDVRFRVFGNTDMTYHKVPWYTEPFEWPPYYAFRLTHFFAANPHFGLMLDFAHDKMLADIDRPLELTGIRNGQPVNTREPINQTLEHLQMTDGINFLTLNVVYRDFWFQTESRPRGWLQPYIGGGIGVSIPTMETTFIGMPETHRYEWRGPAFQAVVGTHIAITRPVSLVIEYKFNNVVVNGNLNEGTMRTVVNSHQLVIGPSFNW